MSTEHDTILDLRPRSESLNPTIPMKAMKAPEQSVTPPTQFDISMLHLDERPNRRTEPIFADLDLVPTGERLLDGGRYQTVERIGTGAAARVYKAIDHQLARKGHEPTYVAIKRFITIGPFGERADERIKLEVLATHKVQSEFVCRNFNLLLLPNGGRAIVMEYIEGRTLMSFLLDGYETDYLRAARWGMQIAAGLADAHKVNVVHRDLKPDNIMIRASNDTACILDFGVAKFFQEDMGLTRAGFTVGTPLYMAPEQFGRNIDPRADLFALGLILARLATGEVPLSGDRTDEEIYRYRVQEQAPYRLKDHAPNAPTEYAMVVDRLLALPREKRFPTGADVAVALQAFIRNAEADTRHSFVVPPPVPTDVEDTTPPAPPVPLASRIPPATTGPLHGVESASTDRPAQAPSRPRRSAAVGIAVGIVAVVLFVMLLAVGAIVQGALKVELSPELRTKLMAPESGAKAH